MNNYRAPFIINSDIKVDDMIVTRKALNTDLFEIKS